LGLIFSPRSTEMRVLVTRPQPDADITAALLRDMGHEPLVAPLLDIQSLESSKAIDFGNVQAILITSANGARALARSTDHRDVPVFAVGEASASTARESGFGDVQSAAGNVATLAALAMDRLHPKNGKLLHITGSVTAGNLAGMLAAAGFGVDKRVLYRAVTKDTLPERIADGLREQNIDSILFYSPRTARTFVDLVEMSKLSNKINNIKILCLSDAVRDVFTKSKIANVQVPSLPEQNSLLELLEKST
jgi:uroporphyrinogen-III synthase